MFTPETAKAYLQRIDTYQIDFEETPLEFILAAIDAVEEPESSKGAMRDLVRLAAFGEFENVS